MNAIQSSIPLSNSCALTNVVQRLAKVLVRGCENFVHALAYLFCLALVGSCLARFAYFLADLCSAFLRLHIETYD